MAAAARAAAEECARVVNSRAAAEDREGCRDDGEGVGPEALLASEGAAFEQVLGELFRHCLRRQDDDGGGPVASKAELMRSLRNNQEIINYFELPQRVRGEDVTHELLEAALERLGAEPGDEITWEFFCTNFASEVMQGFVMGMPDDAQRDAHEKLDAQLEAPAVKYKWWWQTLEQHHWLLGKYPLAAAGERAGGEGRDTNGHGVVDASDDPAEESPAVLLDEAGLDPQATQRPEALAKARSAGRDQHSGGTVSRSAVPKAGGRGRSSGRSGPNSVKGSSSTGICSTHTPARSHQRIRTQATPRSATGRRDLPRPRSAGGYSSHRMVSGGDGYWGPDLANVDVESAWAAVRHANEEVQHMRRMLAHREREVVQREAAVRRAESRNNAAARQLSELRHRLDEYGEELEEGVAALTAQQNTLREEHRQASEMQARARRMCAAAVRDDIVSTKLRDWDRSWTPTTSIGM